MFSKTTSKTQQPQQSVQHQQPRIAAVPSSPTQPDAVRRTAAKPASLLASDLVVEGNISGSGELLIEGVVKGDVHVARLVIGEQAHVEGVLRGDLIEIRGRVHGSIEGKSVRLLQSAHVEGDITHEQLAIEVGAFFQGRCQQTRPPRAEPQAALTSQTPTDVNADIIVELEQAAG